MIQSESDDRVKNNTMRHQYRTLTDAEKAAMLAIKDAGKALVEEIRKLPPCRETDNAVSRAEEAVFWAVKKVTE